MMALVRAAFTAIVLLLASTASVTATHAPTPDVGIRDIREGDGQPAVRHASLRVHYTGWLEDGTEFDSSRAADRGPFEFKVGAGAVIPGWDIGLVGMREGGTRELVVPAELAYGERGAGSVIPPGATLKFEIELLGVTPPPYTNVDNRTVQELLDQGVTLIDIRRPEEWKETGVIPGSELLTAFDGNGRLMPGFASGLAQRVESGERFMLICRTGNRTSVIADALVAQAGYRDVLNVTDGIVSWISEGRAVVKP